MANRYRTCRYFAAILLLSQAILHAAGISSQQPAPGTTNVPVNSSLTISFDEDVSADAGAITIMRSHNLTEFEQIEVGASNVFMDSVIFDFDTDNEGFVEADSTVENAPLWTDERTFSSGGAIETKFLSLEKDFATVQDWSSYDTLLVWIYSDVETHVAYRFHSGEYKNGFDQQPHPGMPVGVGWNRLTIGLDEMSGIDLTEVKSFWLVNNGTASTFYVDRFALKRSGSANVTIIPSQPFEDSVTYFVQIGATAFLGASGDHFAGLSEPSDWRFSTGDEIVAGPDHYYWDTSPADGYQAGDGEWGTDAFWTVNGNGLLAWPGGNSSAQFDGEDGEAGEYAVAVLDTQSTDSIVFNASGYALDGGALAITGGNPSIITAADATITSSLISAATLSKRGSSQLSVTGNVEHQIDQLDLLDGKTVLGTGLFNLNDLRVVGDLEVSGATIDVSGDVVFGDSASATVVLDGTTDAANGVIGRNAGPVVTITDGNHTFSGALYHLDGGNAILNINGGVVSAPQVYSLSNEEADEFTINLNEGGTLETGRIYLSLGATATDAGTHTFQVAFDGGVLEVTDDSDPLFDDIIGEGESESSFEISVLGGGAHINTNGFNPLIRRPITHGGVDALDGGLTKLGEGVLTLAAGAKHTGLTDIQEGTLRLGADNILPHGSGYGNIHIDGTLNLNGHSDTVNGLAGAGTITNAAEQAAVLTVGANDDDFVFDGIIEDGIGQVAFAKEGEGRVTLSADNTFSGGLTVGEG
ncbi:MAG: autotransporter-associated beta strand repeat-containing protein, partial [Chitinivibrionales bacterium]